MNYFYNKLLTLLGLGLLISSQTDCTPQALAQQALVKDSKKVAKKTSKKVQPKSKKKTISPVGDTVVIHHIQGEDDLRNTLSMASGKKLPVLIKVYLSGCPACEHVRPLFDEVSREQSGRALFLAIDAGSSANSNFMNIFSIGAVPTFIALDHKSLSKRSDLSALKNSANIKTGALSKAEITKLVGSHKKAAKQAPKQAAK